MFDSIRRKSQQRDILVFYFKGNIINKYKDVIWNCKTCYWPKIKQKEIQLYWLLNRTQLFFVKLTKKTLTKRFTNFCWHCTHKTWLHPYPTLHFIINGKFIIMHVVHKFEIDHSLTTIARSFSRRKWIQK